MTEVQHPTRDEMVAVTAAHTDADSVIVARIKAVALTLKRGVTVKTLAADMANAAALGDTEVAPVAASTLGYAAATVELLESFGMTPASAFRTDRAAVVAIYRAIYRVKSKGQAFKVLKPAGKTGETDAERLAAMALAAADIRSAGQKTRAARPAGSESDDVTSDDDGGSANVTTGSGAALEEKSREKRVTLAGQVIGALVVGITRDGLTVTDAEAAGLRALMAELDRVLPRAAAPAPRPVPAPRKAKAA